VTIRELQPAALLLLAGQAPSGFKKYLDISSKNKFTFWNSVRKMNITGGT
jgi:hypothetical protein